MLSIYYRVMYRLSTTTANQSGQCHRSPGGGHRQAARRSCQWRPRQNQWTGPGGSVIPAGASSPDRPPNHGVQVAGRKNTIYCYYLLIYMNRVGNHTNRFAGSRSAIYRLPEATWTLCIIFSMIRPWRTRKKSKAPLYCHTRVGEDPK